MGDKLVNQVQSDDFRRRAAAAAWLPSVFYAAFVGGILPQGLQITLLVMLFAVALSRVSRVSHFSSKNAAYTCVIFLSALSFTFVSNHRILALNWLIILFFISMLLISLSLGEDAPDTARSYLGELIGLAGRIILNILSHSTLRQWWGYFVDSFGRSLAWLRCIPLRPILVACIAVIVFNYLFSQINDEHRQLSDWIAGKVWAALKYIYELGIITFIFQSMLSAYVVYGSFTAQRGLKVQPGRRAAYLFDLVKTTLIASVLLFAVFSYFQSQYLLRGFDGFTYKQLALYVQKGFWELLLVAALGAFLWDISHWSLLQDQALFRRKRFWLGIFTVELILLSLFSQHKLLIQQIAFGFRDKRVLASAGVLLITLSFLLYGLQLLKKVSASQLFASQYWVLTGLILLLTFGKLDLFITNYNPIRFEYNGSMYKDYAYLIGNSYDNHAKWLKLMTEAEKTGIPVPDDYYWGAYSSLCGGSRAPQELRRALFRKYSGDHRGLRELLQFNLPEYRAFQIYRDNAEQVGRFISFVEGECRAGAGFGISGR